MRRRLSHARKLVTDGEQGVLSLGQRLQDLIVEAFGLIHRMATGRHAMVRLRIAPDPPMQIARAHVLV